MEKIRLVSEVSGDELKKYYPVIVEQWNHVVPYGSRSGSKHRKYVAEFSKEERKKLKGFYPKWYRWYLVTGHAEWVKLSLIEFQLMKRAANFFASV